MRSITARVDVSSREDDVIIYVLSDLHIGHRASDERMIGEMVARIADEGAYWIGLGDMADAIGRTDGRHKEGLLAEWLWGESRLFWAQREYLARVLKPIGDRCLAYLKGNHEEYVERGGVDLYYSVAEGAGIAPQRLLGMSGFLRLQIKRGHSVRSVVFYAHHGWGGGALLGSQALKIERMPGRYDADVYLMGHVHRPLVHVSRKLYVGSKSGRIQERPVYLATCGAFLRTYVPDETTYAERRGMPPSAPSCLRMQLRDDQRQTVRMEVWS